MIVLKFGGTSVGSGERILNVARIALALRDRQPIVVTSAMSGVTDHLLILAESALAGDSAACATRLAALESRHHEAARVIDSAWDGAPLSAALASLGQSVSAAIGDVEQAPRHRDAIASWGERLAVLLVTRACQVLGGGPDAAAYLTTTATSAATSTDLPMPLITTDATFGEAIPDIEATRDILAPLLAQSAAAILVAPGYIGSAPDGNLTTLGRGGSDYSATLIAAAVGAEACWIYTDVDGVFTADPRVVKDATVLPVVTAATAGRLAMCGAKVLHPRSVAPAARYGIELRVRNTFKPDHPGTLIVAEDPETLGLPQAVAGRKKLSVLALSGHGLSEIPNLFGRMCAAVTEAGVEIVLSAHPVPGHTPEIIVAAPQVSAAIAQLEQELAAEVQRGQVEAIGARAGLALCALVGDELSATVLLQAQRALAQERITPASQSANPDALCFVIPESSLDRAQRAIHREVILPARLALARAGQRPYPDGQWAAGGRTEQRRRITTPQH